MHNAHWMLTHCVFAPCTPRDERERERERERVRGRVATSIDRIRTNLILFQCFCLPVKHVEPYVASVFTCEHTTSTVHYAVWISTFSDFHRSDLPETIRSAGTFEGQTFLFLQFVFAFLLCSGLPLVFAEQMCSAYEIPSNSLLSFIRTTRWYAMTFRKHLFSKSNSHGWPENGEREVWWIDCSRLVSNFLPARGGDETVSGKRSPISTSQLLWRAWGDRNNG